MPQRDRWPDLCKLVEADDGLPVRPCGHWTEFKLHLWSRYLDITTTAMRRAWRTMVYVDLFAGPGVCEIRDPARRIPGSPLLAAHAPRSFDRVFLVELEKATADACRARLAVSPAKDRFQLWQGDCNALVGEVVRAIPDTALTLAFIDPPDLGVDFDTLTALSRAARAVDFLILVADAVDLNRNLPQYIAEQGSKIDRMLPGMNWRRDFDQLPQRDLSAVRRFFLEALSRLLRDRLEYTQCRFVPVRGPNNVLLYTLLYASRHERGSEFWDKIQVAPGNQGLLFR